MPDVKLTNLQKVLWPDDGVTKEDLIRYYEVMSGPLLSELRNRPLTLVRSPDGIAGFTFYQKQAPKYTPEFVRTIPLDSPASKRSVVNYIVCETPDTLRWLGNQAAIELHPTLSRLDRIDRPDVLAFDFDPPPDRFDLAIQAARLVCGLLDEHGLRYALKTTGGKGLHAYVPLERRYDAGQVTRAASLIADAAIAIEPSLVTVAFKKADRGGRVLIDVDRNAGGTMVSAFSPRAKPGAPVSFPVELEDLERISPLDFTVRHADELARSPAVARWHETLSARQRLPAALR